MTDSESNPVAKASSAWTDPERWAFVMQIIKQLTKDGAKIKWTESKCLKSDKVNDTLPTISPEGLDQG